MTKTKQDEMIDVVSELINVLKSTKQTEEGFFSKMSNVIITLVLTGIGSLVGYNYNTIAGVETKQAVMEATYLTKAKTEELFLSKWEYLQVEREEHDIIKTLFDKDSPAIRLVFGDDYHIGSIDRRVIDYLQLDKDSRSRGGSKK